MYIADKLTINLPYREGQYIKEGRENGKLHKKWRISAIGEKIAWARF